VASAFGATVAAQQSNLDAVGDLARVTAQVLEAQTALLAAMAQLREAETTKRKTE
jgi:Tfp pilus assembly protein PilX